MTDGAVLEMGMGYCSTPILHWLCAVNKRKLVSIDNDPKYFKIWKSFACDFHQLFLVEDWEQAEIETNWDVVLIDHKPAERRKEDVKRLANLAKLLVLHDSNGSNDKLYHYSEIYPLFKWKFVYGKYYPETVLLSNVIDLTGFAP